MDKNFHPDYTNILMVVHNQRPNYLPLYEHHIDAPFTKWIDSYSRRIGLFGGFDMNELILNSYDYVFEKVRREGTQFRSMANGYGLGSGNSIPEYAEVEGFMAMIDAVKAIRKDEKVNQ